MPGGIWVVSQSTVLTTCCHFGACSFCSTGILRRRIIFTIVRSSILVETSTKISTRCPPIRRPVKYCLFPSPVKLRIRFPASSGVTLAADSLSFSSLRSSSSDLSCSIASLRAFVSSVTEFSSFSVLRISSITSSRIPANTAISSISLASSSLS